jgi:hypothetical protein
VTNYLWLNLVWLACIFGLGALIVSELGGNSLAQVMSAVWLSFGVNFFGAVIGPRVPPAWQAAHASLINIWGDNRYTPWLDKVLFIGQLYFGMAFFSAILYLMLKPWPGTDRRDNTILTGLSLCGIGLIYPVLLPPACALVGARIIWILLDRFKNQKEFSLGEIAGLSLTIGLAGLIAFVNTVFLTLDRASHTIAQFNDLQLMRWRIAETVIVTGPLLIGAAFTLRKFWTEKRLALSVMSMGALASFLLYILFDIPWWRNEYKFIFTAAICLAPFPSLAMEPLMRRLGRWTLPTIAIVTVLVAAPFILKVNRGSINLTEKGPLVDIRHFTIRLADTEPYSTLTDAIRLKTPLNSLLVLENNEIYFPTLTQRQLYAPPVQNEPFPGILITSDEMLTLAKGYSPEILASRRVTVEDLFESNDETKMARALDQIRQFNLPIALILEEQRNAGLRNWIESTGIGKRIFEESQMEIWLIDQNEVPPKAVSTP